MELSDVFFCAALGLGGLSFVPLVAVVCTVDYIAPNLFERKEEPEVLEVEEGLEI